MPEEKDDSKRVTARKWMERIKRSLKYRDSIRDNQNWKRILDEYEGEYKINSGDKNAPPINLVFGYCDTATARIYFRDPHMTINPRGAQSINAARIMELDVNAAFGKLKLKANIEKVLKDSWLVGHGWLKFGYISEIGEKLSDLGTEPSEYIKNEEIFITYVPWEDVVFDTTMSKDPPYDCRWIAHRIIKTVKEMKGDNSYTNTAGTKSNISTREAGDDKDDDQLKDSDAELFEFWEVTDLDTMKVYAVADNMDKYLRESDYRYEMTGLNFSMLKFNTINKKPYPLSDIFIIEAQILERVKLRAAQINHIKRWSRQLSIEEGAMKPEEMQKFKQGIDGGISQRVKGSQPPSPIQYAPIGDESFQIDDLIQRDIDSVIGQTETDRGGVAKTQTKTKFELQGQMAGSGSRQAKRQDKLEDFLEEVTEKYISLVKQFQTTPKYVRITGMTPEAINEAFGALQGVQVDATGIKFTREAIQGDYDIEAKAGSTLPLNRENKVKLIESSLQLGPILGVIPGSPTSIALGKALFRELDMLEVSEAFDQQAQQMEQMQAAGQVMGPGGPGMPQGAPQPPQPQGQPPLNVVHHQAPPGVLPSPGAM